MSTELNFPPAELRRRQSETGKPQLWDPIRKIWTADQPEEQVRQRLIRFLIDERGFPAGRMSVERQIKLNGLAKRYDLVVFDRQLRPLVLAECKAPTEKIAQRTFRQIARYNLTMRVPFLIVTNGLRHFCCEIDLNEGQYRFVPDFWFWHSLETTNQTPD